MRLLFTLFLSVLLLGVACGQKIAPGDKLEITVSGNKDLTGVYTVGPQGTIIMPFIGVVDVKDMTKEEAAQKIQRILREQRIVLDPKVTVSAPGTPAPPQTVTISGAVGKPGEVAVGQGASLETLLAKVEPNENANLGSIRLTAPDGSVTSVDYASYKKTGAAAGNPTVLPGSTIYVTIQPEGEDVTVLGAVAKPGVVKYVDGMTLARAIQAAGGAKTDGDIKRIEVRHKGGEQAVVNLAAVGGNLTLTRGDQVYVPVAAGSRYIMVRGAVRNPGLVPFSDGMTLMSALNAAGGPTDSGRLDRVEILRPSGGKSTTIKVDEMAVQRGQASDPEVFAGDTINVPYQPKPLATGEVLNYIWIILSIILIFRR